MTQLTNFNVPPSFTPSNFPQNLYNFDANQREQLEEMSYYVREPNGKRPFPAEFEMDMEYVPRTKRRFDKISASLENFSISSDKPSPINLESSSDEEMDEMAPDIIEEEEEPKPLVVEPDDEPAMAKKIRLDENLQKYLDRYKQMHFLPKKEALKGNEIALWQPKILVSPKNDFNMTGRIQEIDDEESDRIEEEARARIIDSEGMVDEETNSETTGIVDYATSDHSDIGSSWSSRECSPTGSTQCVELENSPTSLTNGSVTDEEEMMEFE